MTRTLLVAVKRCKAKMLLYYVHYYSCDKVLLSISSLGESETMTIMCIHPLVDGDLFAIVEDDIQREFAFIKPIVPLQLVQAMNPKPPRAIILIPKLVHTSG